MSGVTGSLRPGLLVLHGNQLELLAQAVFGWLARHPLDALEEEVFLVQSNGMAEWLKMQLAQAQGVCAATRLELPARFVWRAYRAVLGRAVVPAVSALDKQPLTWRLMHLLPSLVADPATRALFAPVAAFLGEPGAATGGADEPERRLQLARRLADLLDQYQVYRSHWLQDWARGEDVLRRHPRAAPAGAPPVPEGQAWQPALWRALLAGLGGPDRQTARPVLHQRYLEALAAGNGVAPALPRRLVLFGSTHIPHQTLEAIAALATRSQVILAVPNPCRFHWADTLDGRELLAAPRRRHPLRGAADPARLPLHALHAHGHPLLAAWGRQARDFVRQLDAFDDAQHARAQFDLPRIDLFSDGPGTSLLGQIQAQIRDLVPLGELAQVATPPAADDRSIVFHIAHSAQREVEVLHDQLLALLAQPPGGAAEGDGSPPLAPRDIVVMVPDIAQFAPAIRAVFGQFPRGHPRHLPWGLADQRLRSVKPLLVALEWLLHAPQQRFALSQLRDLLDVPAVARRLGLAADDLPTLMDWVEAAGVRWGLDAPQRHHLGLGACGDTNTWHFGLQRLLLGYASGALDEGFAGIQPLAEVAGLDAGLAGDLAEWLARLTAWWADAGTPRPPEAWAQRLRALLAALFEPADEADQALLAALEQALARWLEACSLAGFEQPVPLAVAREAWLDALDEPGGAARFRAGGVTFCTLLPLRAIPFEVVCLLGMNEGDYPRRSPRSDFDLMALPGQALPGDRSRRDDDRQLMLDALLSARRVLYLSWAGRSLRDNQAQPPSVLVGQLRDHLAAGWGTDVLAQRTVEHPLQPFSRRYFAPAAERAPGVFTFAAEWREAHDAPATDPKAAEGDALPAPSANAVTQDTGTVPPATLAELEALLRNPVKQFFQQRLLLRFDAIDDPRQDDELFAPDGLQRWQLLNEALAPLRPDESRDAPVHAQAERQLAALARAGRLPLGGPGQRWQATLADALRPMVHAWQDLLRRHPHTLPPLALRWQPADEDAGIDPATTPCLDDAIAGLRQAGNDAHGEDAPGPWHIALVPGRLLSGKGERRAPRADRLLGAWLRALASSAQAGPDAPPTGSWLVGEDACLRCTPPPPAQAQAALAPLLQALGAQRHADAPLPTALNTGLAWLASGAEAAAKVYDGGFAQRAEGREPCLQRLYPDFQALQQAPGFEAACHTLYAALQEWLAADVQILPLPGAQPLDDGEAAATGRED